MITDDRTYVVFLSTWLKKSYPKFFDKFTACLNENDIKWRFIGNTADIWCRDYMPIQIETDEFVQYRYYPDYLTKRESDKKYITNPDKACKSIGVFLLRMGRGDFFLRMKEGRISSLKNKRKK